MITSTKNPKIIQLRKLQQRKQRRAQNRFAVEGLQLIGLACQANLAPLDVFYCADHFQGEGAPKLYQQLLELGGSPQPVNARVMQSLSERDAPQGLIVTFPLFEASLSDLIMPSDLPSLLIVVDRLQDPGNLGTLIRTADAVAASGLILVEPCVDLFDPKTVRGSMGSIFNLPIHHTANPNRTFADLAQAGYKLIGADGYQGTIPWHNNQAILAGSVALILGNEARGLSDDLRHLCTDWVRLPLLGQAESLNVAVAGAVLMYQWLQINQSN